MRVAEGKSPESDRSVSNSERQQMAGVGVHCCSLSSFPDTKIGVFLMPFGVDFLAFMAAHRYDSQRRKEVRDSPSFQRSIEHCSYVIDLHLWQKTDHATFATFVYNKTGERLLRHFANTNETEVIRKALAWCERHAADSRLCTSVSAP
jgi:hypothetical protein